MSSSNSKWKLSSMGAFLLEPSYRIVDGVTPDSEKRLIPNGELSREMLKFSFGNGVSMRVSPIGCFLFDFAEDSSANFTGAGDQESHIKSRMRFMNLFLVSLYTEMLRNSKPANEKMYVDDLSYIAAAQDSGLHPLFGKMDSSVHHRKTDATKWFSSLKLNVELVERAATKADEANQKHGLNARTQADFLLQAFSLFQRHHNETAHVVSWAIIEYCVNFIWSSFLDESAGVNALEGDVKFLNSERRQKLTGRDFSISTITEVLSLNGKIDFETYCELNRVRGHRNRWLHKMTPIPSVDACAALNLSVRLLRLTQLLDVEFFIPSIWSPLVSLERTEQEKVSPL